MIEIVDVVRDGAQDPRFRSSVERKTEMVLASEEFGIELIEGGWPGANAIDTEFFRQMRGVLRDSQLIAFGMTIKGTRADKDAGLRSLLESGTDIITLVGKTWRQNVERTLRIPWQENLDNIFESIKFLRGQRREVFFDAEHWFDGRKQNKEHAFEVLEAAIAGGANRLVLCDTRGASSDRFIYEAVTDAVARFPDAKFGIHAHGDGGLAEINTIRALEAGVVQVQGTVNGIGERTGNMNLCTFLPTLQFIYGIETGLDLTRLTPFARAVADICGIPIHPDAPYVGENAFAHKAGLHASGQKRDESSYQFIRPEDVGNKQIYIFSEQSGSTNLEIMLEKHGYALSRKNPKFRSLLEKMETSLLIGDTQQFLFLYEHLEGKQRPFSVLEGTGVEDFSPLPPKARVKVRINGDQYFEEAVGVGPINAIDIALKKVLLTNCPEVSDIELLDYSSVGLLEGNPNTASEVEVCVKVRFNGEEVTSVVRGTNQNRVGVDALEDAYNYCIIKHRRRTREKVLS